MKLGLINQEFAQLKNAQAITQKELEAAKNSVSTHEKSLMEANKKYAGLEKDCKDACFKAQQLESENQLLKQDNQEIGQFIESEQAKTLAAIKELKNKEADLVKTKEQLNILNLEIAKLHSDVSSTRELKDK